MPIKGKPLQVPADIKMARRSHQIENIAQSQTPWRNSCPTDLTELRLLGQDFGGEEVAVGRSAEGGLQSAHCYRHLGSAAILPTWEIRRIFGRFFQRFTLFNPLFYNYRSTADQLNCTSMAVQLLINFFQLQLQLQVLCPPVNIFRFKFYGTLHGRHYICFFIQSSSMKLSSQNWKAKNK